MKCPVCDEENPDDKSFCGDCGTPLHTEFPQSLQTMIANELDLRLKDQKSVELETAELVLTRLVKWARLFAIIAVIPVTILLSLFTFFGINQYSDISEEMTKLSEEMTKFNEEIEEARTFIIQKTSELLKPDQQESPGGGRGEEGEETVTKKESGKETGR